MILSETDSFVKLKCFLELFFGGRNFSKPIVGLSAKGFEFFGCLRVRVFLVARARRFEFWALDGAGFEFLGFLPRAIVFKTRSSSTKNSSKARSRKAKRPSSDNFATS